MTTYPARVDYPSVDSSTNSSPSHSLRRITVIMVAATLLICASAPIASGESGYIVHPGGVDLIVPLGERDGYTVSVSANDQQRVKLLLESDFSRIQYSAEGRVTSRRIKASFGALGQIDIRLRLIAHPRDPDRKGKCRGRAPLYKEGIYRGSITFPPQTDIPGIFAKRGDRAYFERRFRQVCRRQRHQPSREAFPQTEEALLRVRGREGGRTIRLDAAIYALKRNPVTSGGAVSVVAFEGRGNVRISRGTSTFFKNNSFVLSRRGLVPETIGVALPAPFTGDALYSHSPGSLAGWTGDLGVDLPGLKGLSLTGPRFSASLCRGGLGACV